MQDHWCDNHAVCCTCRLQCQHYWCRYVCIYIMYTQTHTVGLLGIRGRLREGSLARKGLLERSTKAGGEVEGCRIPESSWHAHGACAKWCCNTAWQAVVKQAGTRRLKPYNNRAKHFFLMFAPITLKKICDNIVKHVTIVFKMCHYMGWHQQNKKTRSIPCWCNIEKRLPPCVQRGLTNDTRT